MTIIEHHAFRLTRNADLRWKRTRPATCWPPWSSSCTAAGSARRCGWRRRPASPTDLLEMLIAEVDVPEDNVYLFDVPIDLERPAGR